MTYDEIKQRLTQVENSLQALEKKVKPNVDTSYASKSIEQLSTLKESLQKQLLAEEETMFVSTKGGDTKAVKMDMKTAMDLKKDPAITSIDTAKGKSLKEVDRLVKNSGVEFTKNETKAIAKEVGKSLAIALKNAGDELARMKAHRIDINSFDIEVIYKGERGSDEFAFHIVDDKLHLVDFSFDKELVEVGVKPSGEAIINRDVLANELLKHFKSLNEEMAVFSSEEDEDKYIEKMVKKGLEKEKERAAKKKKGNLKEVRYDHYTTPKHFDICPGAEALRDEVLASGKSPEELGEWTFKHDELFKLEKAVLKANKADERHVKVANKLRSEIIHLSRDLGIEAGKINYLKGHVKKIEDVAAGKEVDEGLRSAIRRGAAAIKGKAASIGTTVGNFGKLMQGKKDAVKDPALQRAFAQVSSLAKNFGSDAKATKDNLMKLFPSSVMSKLPAEAQEELKKYFNAVNSVMDLSGEYVNIGKNIGTPDKAVNEGEGDDHHYLKVSRREYKKAMSILDQNVDPTYVKMEVVDNDGAGNVIIYFVFRHEYGFDDMYDDPEGKENPEFYQEPDEDPSAFMYDVVMDLRANDITVVDSSADMDENYDPDQEQKDDEEDHGVAYDDDGRPLGEDLDVGHQDDEPSMLKSSAFETATYAAKLAKKLAQYDQVDGEVDFPNWWQKKLILARDYMSAAYHYLDSEEKQPLIDKLALEHAMNEGTELYDRNGINIKRFSGGKRGLMVQITYGGDYIHVPAEEFETLARAMQSVQGDLKDMSTQYPRRKNIDEIKAAKIQKAHGQVVAKMKELAKQYKAGDKSVVSQLKDLTAKKKQLEKHLVQAVAGTHKGQELTELSTDQRNDLVELQNILDDVAQKGDEAREIIRSSFPRMLSKADAYGAFDFGSSANRYDTTLESIIEEIEEYYDEEEDDMDEGKYKSDAQRKAIYATKAEKGELKEFTDNRFKGSEVIDNANERGPDMFGKGIFADLLPKGVASENDAIEALKAHDKSPIKARMGQYAPMFVHMQYHELEHEGEKYRMHQKQYYNSNFKDKDPDFNPGVSEITLMKVDENDEGHNLGTIIVKTDQYIQDLRNLPGLGKRHMEEATRQDLGMTSSVSKRRAKAELKKTRNDGSKVYGLDKDGKRVELKDLNDVDKFKKFELDADLDESGPGFKHDCAAKVVHEKYGKGNTIPEKHTLVKEGSKYVVTHYDVLFESGKTVTDIPVSELEIKTQNEHWHKGYKKKKK